MIGFEVVAFAGEARSKLMEALEEAEKKNFEQAERLVEEAHTSLMQAHKSQTQMLAAEQTVNQLKSVLSWSMHKIT